MAVCLYLEETARSVRRKAPGLRALTTALKITSVETGRNRMIAFREGSNGTSVLYPAPSCFSFLLWRGRVDGSEKKVRETEKEGEGG